MNPFTEAWHTGNASFDFWLTVELALVLSTAFGMFMEAPYGKHGSSTLGSLQLSPRLGWWLMELPATVAFLATWFLTPAGAATGASWTPSVLAALWCVHYGNRGWYFPLNIRVAKGSTTNFNLTISLVGAVFTGLHGHLNAKMFRSLGEHYTDSWLSDPRFMLGLLVYEVGFWTTVHSEHVMRVLRPKDGVVRDGQRYKIPRGGAFEYVTSAQYLGELTAFLGFACMTWSLPGLAVFVITFFNLVPRSFQNHAWYLKKFGDEYKKLRRKALVPFVL